MTGSRDPHRGGGSALKEVARRRREGGAGGSARRMWPAGCAPRSIDQRNIGRHRLPQRRECHGGTWRRPPRDLGWRLPGCPGSGSGSGEGVVGVRTIVDGLQASAPASGSGSAGLSLTEALRAAPQAAGRGRRRHRRDGPGREGGLGTRSCEGSPRRRLCHAHHHVTTG